jgi:dienelactone hydrolase
MFNDYKYNEKNNLLELNRRFSTCTAGKIMHSRSFLWMMVFFIALSGCDPLPASEKYNFLKPTGSYSIGTRYLTFSDSSRYDMNSKDSSHYRKLSIRTWYPAEVDDGNTFEKFNHRATAEFWVNNGLFVSSFVNKVATQPSHSILNAPLSKVKSSYPVVFYSASGVLDANIFMAEELASHGYVVLCIGHPHWCAYYFDSDGKVLFRDEEKDFYNKKMWEEENSEVVRDIKEKLTLAKTVDEKLAFQLNLNQQMPLEIKDIHLWVEDYGFIIDQLEKMNQSDRLFRHGLNLQQAGVMGYSKGGAAAGQACLVENRIKAGVNLSGFMFGDIGEKDLSVPFMVIEGIEPWCKDCPPINDLLYHLSKSSIYMVQIDGALHGNFCDLSAFKEFLTADFQGLLGTIDGRRFLEIQNEFVRQFFDRYLQGLQAPLLESKAVKYPEVVFKSNHR